MSLEHQLERNEAGSPSRALADFAAGTSFADLPAKVVERARLSVLDAIGASLLGSLSVAASPLAGIFVRPGEAGQATLLNSTARLASATAAAMTNAGQLHVTEIGEIVSRAVVHSSTVVVPSALAVAEQQDASGRELLRAVALANEALIRFGYAAATDPDDANQARGIGDARPKALGFPGLMLAPLGSCAAAGLVRGFTGQLLDQAWEIAASTAPLAGAYFPTTSKGALMGLAVGGGLVAADLATAGLRGPSGVVEHWFPLWLSGFGAHRITDGLGQRYECASTMFKYFACGGPLQPAIIAALAAIELAPPFPAEDVEDILVEGFGRLVAGGHRPLTTPDGRPGPFAPPANAQAAKHNLAYLVAEALVTRDEHSFLYDAFTPAHYEEPVRLELARKVRIELNPEYDRLYPATAAKAKITIRLAGGRTLEYEADRTAIPRQHHPARSDLEDKFRAVTAQVLEKDRAEAVIDFVWHLDEQPVRELTALLR